MTSFKYIKQQYLGYTTGRTKAQQEWDAWHQASVDFRATHVEDVFHKFKHVIRVDPHKFLQSDTWDIDRGAKQYFWPACALNESCVWAWLRCSPSRHNSDKWEIDELGGTDMMFVATNNEYDALTLSLKYG